MMPQTRAAAVIDSARLPLLVPILAAALWLGGCAGLPWTQENLRGGYAPKDQVVAILPGSGPVATVAEAVREGLRAAHGADDTGTKPALKFIASDQPEKIGESYKKALEGGATQVIGPLLKPAVDLLASGPALKVPTLALNQTTKPGKAAANLYQFALAPETDAVEVANKARAQGFTRALMLRPAGEAGQRRADAFRRQWKLMGGTLVAEAAIDPGTDPGGAPGGPPGRDPGREIDALLAKGGAQFLFLAADADQARVLFPTLRTKAAALPVIATSAVHSGGADAARDRALSGLYFVDAPWMLGIGASEDPLALAKLKRGSGALATPLGLRLYAMGIDAYRLAPRLAALAKTPGARFPGETGTLSIDAQGRVQRTLTLAQFTPTGLKPVAAMAAGAGPAASAGAPAAGPAVRPQSDAKAAPATPGEPVAAPKTGPAAKAKPRPRPKAKPATRTKAAVPAASVPEPSPAPPTAPTPIANLATAAGAAPKAKAAPVSPAPKPEPRDPAR